MDLWFKLNLTGFVLMVFTYLITITFCGDRAISDYVKHYPLFWILATTNIVVTTLSSFCYAIALIWI